jgi:hypothetical protein
MNIMDFPLLKNINRKFAIKYVRKLTSGCKIFSNYIITKYFSIDAFRHMWRIREPVRQTGPHFAEHVPILPTISYVEVSGTSSRHFENRDFLLLRDFIFRIHFANVLDHYYECSIILFHLF